MLRNAGSTGSDQESAGRDTMQANVTSRRQQINNWFSTSSRVREAENARQAKLFKTNNGELDAGATGTASGANQALATVGMVNGLEDRTK